eukprot:GHVQ01036208.1.p1 GENE.GHVQ01036208.1~~GHVQ01036208.1.p1  ORF type:complete len:574 (-),score=81.08 GHVQ01036208.1:504-2225(-)
MSHTVNSSKVLPHTVPYSEFIQCSTTSRNAAAAAASSLCHNIPSSTSSLAGQGQDKSASCNNIVRSHPRSLPTSCQQTQNSNNSRSPSSRSNLKGLRDDRKTSTVPRRADHPSSQTSPTPVSPSMLSPSEPPAVSDTGLRRPLEFRQSDQTTYASHAGATMYCFCRWLNITHRYGVWECILYLMNMLHNHGVDHLTIAHVLVLSLCLQERRQRRTLTVLNAWAVYDAQMRIWRNLGRRSVVQRNRSGWRNSQWGLANNNRVSLYGAGKRNNEERLAAGGASQVESMEGQHQYLSSRLSTASCQTESPQCRFFFLPLLENLLPPALSALCRVTMSACLSVVSSCLKSLLSVLPCKVSSFLLSVSRLVTVLTEIPSKHHDMSTTPRTLSAASRRPHRTTHEPSPHSASASAPPYPTFSSPLRYALQRDSYLADSAYQSSKPPQQPSAMRIKHSTSRPSPYLPWHKLTDCQLTWTIFVSSWLAFTWIEDIKLPLLDWTEILRLVPVDDETARCLEHRGFQQLFIEEIVRFWEDLEYVLHVSEEELNIKYRSLLPGFVDITNLEIIKKRCPQTTSKV